MSNENIQLKIDLLQEQIDNLEKSGFFTEKEINSRSIPLQSQLAIYNEAKRLYVLSESSKRIADHILCYAKMGEAAYKAAASLDFGLSKESYEEGKKIHNELFMPFSALKLKVVDAQILTPNHQEA